jgi:hypothetical protein
MEPYYGIGVLAHDFMKQGGSQVQFGTEEWPALAYVTGDVIDVNSNFVLFGNIVCLGNWSSSGGPLITYDPDFLDNLPGYFRDDWVGDTSGTMRILRWREVASTGG